MGGGPDLRNRSPFQARFPASRKNTGTLLSREPGRFCIRARKYEVDLIHSIMPVARVARHTRRQDNFVIVTARLSHYLALPGAPRAQLCRATPRASMTGYP
jgi:hypothetical protein